MIGAGRLRHNQCAVRFQAHGVIKSRAEGIALGRGFPQGKRTLPGILIIARFAKENRRLCGISLSQQGFRFFVPVAGDDHQHHQQGHSNCGGCRDAGNDGDDGIALLPGSSGSFFLEPEDLRLHGFLSCAFRFLPLLLGFDVIDPLAAMLSKIFAVFVIFPCVKEGDCLIQLINFFCGLCDAQPDFIVLLPVGKGILIQFFCLGVRFGNMGVIGSFQLGNAPGVGFLRLLHPIRKLGEQMLLLLLQMLRHSPAANFSARDSHR